MHRADPSREKDPQDRCRSQTKLSMEKAAAFDPSVGKPSPRPSYRLTPMRRIRSQRSTFGRLLKSAPSIGEGSSKAKSTESKRVTKAYERTMSGKARFRDVLSIES